MQEDIKRKHGDLTAVKHTYAKVLFDHKAELEKNYMKMDTYEFKRYIIEIVEAESNSTQAQRNFLLNVQRKNSSSSLLQYCWNAIMSADNLEVI